MSKTLKIWICALVAGLLFAAPAAWAEDDEVFRAITGEDLVDILQSQGFGAQLEYDSYGDPMIIAEAGTLTFHILTYGCNASREPSCARLQLYAQFLLPDGASESDIALMNAYNQQFLFGRAYIDPYGSATVDYTINLNQGVTEDNLVDNLNIWLQFEQHYQTITNDCLVITNNYFHSCYANYITNSTVVPSPGLLIITSSPPTSCTLSRIPSKPK